MSEHPAGIWDDARMDALRFEADPLADTVIAAHAAHHAAYRESSISPQDLPRELGRHMVLPPVHRSPPLEKYLTDAPPWPEWADPGLVKRGEDFFSLLGLEIGSTLFCASLPEAYAGARGARVLTLTSRMVSNPVRRVNETAQMIFHALQPDGLLPGSGPGYLDTRRVRLMHAAVRYLILNDDRVVKTDAPSAGEHTWNPSVGLPINQEDLLGTLMTFTCVVFTSLERLGIEYQRADAEAYLHTWCLVGYLLGIQPDILPISLDSAWALTDAIKRRQQRPSPDGELLGRALSGAMQRSLPPPLRGLPDSTIRWLIGDEVATMVGIRGGNWTRVLFGPLHRLLSLVPLVDSHSLLVRSLTNRVTAGVLNQFVSAGREGSKPQFALPDHLDQRVRQRSVSWRLWPF